MLCLGLLSVDSEDAFDSASEVNVHGYIYFMNQFIQMMIVYMNFFFFEFRRCVFDHGSFNRWTINTKYYTADVAVWMAHLHDGFSVENLPAFQRMTALVMVFDMNDVSFFTFIFL
jgi:hypothetical protein